MEETIATNTIMAALASLSPVQLSDLTHSIFSDAHHRRRRLSAVLSSPSLFSLTLRRLHFLSLPDKTLLIARLLLSSLRLLTSTSTSAISAALSPRDYDAVLLLLHLCETRHHYPKALQTPPFQWRGVLADLYAQSLLTAGSGIGAQNNGSVLVPYIETVVRCLRFVFGGERKGGGEVAAAVAAVVALPSVEVVGVIECVICREEMREGREVCGLPCQHVFHWKCILPWLTKKNTCPCCRFQLPTDDVFTEIRRLWDVLLKRRTFDI